MSFKKAASAELTRLIAAHKGIVRQVNTTSVCDYASFTDGKPPNHVSWDNLKFSRKITEFVSDQSRAMGLNADDVTLDKIILSWRSLDVLEQVVLYGIDMTVLNEENQLVTKHYHFQTASAGQLRTDKVQLLSDEIWQKIKPRMECGMDWETINVHGGMNVNKLMAYTALASSATDVWDFPIDRCLVIKDFEAPVSGIMDYIKPGYIVERGLREVLINHCDGCGMALPGVLPSPNVMVRGPYIKGLLTTFDFIAFCSEHGVSPVIRDVWGEEHDLIQEGITVLLTESQHKLWKYYDSWQHYKNCFKSCGCTLNVTNYEEDIIQNTTLNYQMTQTLVDMTDEEVAAYTAPTRDRINAIASNKAAMLKTLGADIHSSIPYSRALAIYPELLHDGYAKSTIRAIKKRMLWDAKSGCIYCENKRLFAIPDMYAACEFWFLGKEKPEGLLPDGCVWSPVYKNTEELDILRSPHLYFEHSVRKIYKTPEIEKWFTTNGIYTSCHDLISRVLQFDNDGDMLNCVLNKIIIAAAKRNQKNLNIVPLFYDAYKADKEQVSFEAMFNGLKRAHEYSGIGQVSNNLTKLWNKKDPDVFSAACLCRFNNAVIDAAKCGKIDSYEHYPELNARIRKATGGKRGKMPFFFQYSKNGRRGSGLRAENCAKLNDSVMNRICLSFNNVGRLNLRLASIPPFDFRMLLSETESAFNPEIVQVFMDAVQEGTRTDIGAGQVMDMTERSRLLKDGLMTENVVSKIEAVMPLEQAYSSIVKHLFVDENARATSFKQEFWNVFGDIALRNIETNLKSCHVCPKCGAKYPVWTSTHTCPSRSLDMIECASCGKLVERTSGHQLRCPECQAKHRQLMVAQHVKNLRQRRKQHKKTG